MFSLAHKVSGKERSFGTFIRHNKNFTRACNHININNTVKKLFSSCNKNITGAYNFINFRYFFSTECQSGNSLRPAYKEYPINTGNCGSSHNIRIRITVFSGRGNHNNFLNTCNFSRNCIHQNR